jgi:hypothetical protein
MTQQTSIEWLLDEIEKQAEGKYEEIPICIYIFLEQAKAMEKEQIIDAATWGALAETGEQYYKEKYNNQTFNK